MSAKTEAKEKSGGSGILLLLLAIVGGLWLRNKSKETAAVEATDDAIPDYSGGGGGYGYYQDDVIVDIGGDDGSSDTGSGSDAGNKPSSGGASSGSTTPIKQAMTTRTMDAEWQYQKSRINMAVIPDYQKRQIEKGAVTKNTLKSIADYQQVKAGTMSAYDYAGGAAAMPGIDPVAYDYASTAYQRASVKSRALAYYSGITGAHRGGMTAAERTAWDSANEQAALTAYAAAAGSGLQADRARELAGTTLTGKISIEQAGTMKTTQPVTPKKAIADDPNRLVRQTSSTTFLKGPGGIAPWASKPAKVARTSTSSKATSGLGLGVSKGSAQPGKGSTSSGKKSTGKTSTSKGTSGLGKGASIGKK